MNLKFKEWLLPLAAAIVIYSIFSLIYFAPQLRGDTLSMHDRIQYKGMASDIIESRERTGVDPQWNGSMFGGMPAYMISVQYPSRIIKNSVGSIQNLVGEPINFIIFAMLAMWLMLVMMGFNSWVAIVAGLMYGLSTYLFLIIGAGHISKVWAMVYAPPMFGAMYMTLRGNMWVGATLTALFASLHIGANHLQITYYFILVMAIYWIWQLVEVLRQKSRDIAVDFTKRSAALLLAGVVAVGSTFSPFWYAAEHSSQTVRGGSPLTIKGEGEEGKSGLDFDYATAWSYGKMESFNMFIPNLMGGESAQTFSKDGAVAQTLAPYGYSHIAQQLPTYWGEQPYTAGPTYIGAVVIFLALFALFTVKRREWLWVVVVSIFALLLAWGYHISWFNELIFKILPGYNKFRAVSTTLTIVEWTMPLLACYALSKLWDSDSAKELNRKGLITATAICSAIALLFALFGSSFLSFGRSESFQMLAGAGFPDDIARRVSAAMAQERADILAADCYRTLIFTLLSAGVLYASISGWIKRGVMLALIGVLVVVDIAGVNWRYLSHDDFYAPSAIEVRPTSADIAIMGDKELGFRVFDLRKSPFNDATASYFHRSVGGYHGAKLARYQDLITHYLGRGDDDILDMLNTKYTITRDSVVTRSTANGTAWYVSDLVNVNSPQEEIESLAQIDTKVMVVVDSSFGVEQRSGLDRGVIAMDMYEPNYQRYHSSSQSDGVVVFSEIYYNKGWHAFIDGVEVPYFRANYILRAIEVPAGEHTIEWRFRAPRWSLVEGVSYVSNILIILALILIVIFYARREKIKA